MHQLKAGIQEDKVNQFIGLDMDSLVKYSLDLTIADVIN